MWRPVCLGGRKVEEDVFTNIAVVAQPGLELQAIRSQLRNPVKYTVREFLSLEDINQGLRHYSFDILLMRLNRFDSAQVNTVLRVKARFPRIGLITVSPEISPPARFQVKDVSRHKLLLEPIELEDLTAVIDKMVRGEGAPTRLHPRVARSGECELVDVERKIRIPAKFIDFAQMGARISLSPREPLKANSYYQLHYRSTTEPSRIHKIESKIIWGQVSSSMVGTIIKGPEQTLGVRFIAAV